MNEADFPKAPPHPNAVQKNPELLKSVDERVSFDQSASQWIFEENDTEYIYNFILQRWMPKVIRDEEEVEGKKRQKDADTEEDENKRNIKRLKKEQLQAVKDEINRLKNNIKKTTGDKDEDKSSNNTGAYVSNLPDNISKQDLIDSFSKYGMISEDYKTGEPRVKLYYDKENHFKNEALVIYHSPDSVSLAIEMLNDSYILPPTDKSQKKIRVERADFSNSSSKDDKKERRVLTQEEKDLLNQRKEAMRKKLTEWDDETSDNKVSQIKQKVWSKMVVATNMFRKEEFSKDSYLEIDLKDDITDECNKLEIGNDITSIKIYDQSAVIVIKFNKAELASKCIEAFDGRYYDGLKLSVARYNGEKFSHSVNPSDEANRLDQFGDWLENGDNKIAT
ncbi:hypothetical protein HYPBUDRAFT_109735 [Hyphopichia burtonii NRRL Y-1933]|uniref:RRM domain-containing protein n=1 Tax=Hyphopichia burtonii NRRL Y-1933 TaxID=984485 RepID=A0A1E4RIB0_9ASCO|nr:hypothetical protein HYPBUDRAFT_109735 [Hyphopichia burtonii NRRL Y-1933]ODV66835.1 hypothetical protein HYPBUDRAFT_109735 [Hyphopichia burtonii NRRL Y-1933]